MGDYSVLESVYVPLATPSAPWLHGYASADVTPKDDAGRMVFLESYCHIVWSDIPDAAAYLVKIDDPDGRTINVYNTGANEFIYSSEMARQQSSYAELDGSIEIVHFRAIRQFTVTIATVDAIGIEAWGDSAVFYVPPSVQHSMSIAYNADVAFLAVNTATANYSDIADSTILIWGAESISGAESSLNFGDGEHLYYDSSALILSTKISPAITIPRGSATLELASVIYDAWTTPRIASGSSDPGLPWDFDYVQPQQFDVLLPIIDRITKFAFNLPTAVWVINHNTNSYPPVRTLDSAGTQVFGAIVYNDSNTITITFSAAFSGTVYL